MKSKKNISKVVIDIQKNVESESLSNDKAEEIEGGNCDLGCRPNVSCGSDNAGFEKG